MTTMSDDWRTPIFIEPTLGIGFVEPWGILEDEQ